METRINIHEKGQAALKSLFGIGAYLHKSSLDKRLLHLIYFRVSQINKCAYCLDMHYKDARAMGETEQRLYGLNAWEESPYYSELERTAFAWAEAVTRAVTIPESLHAEIQQHFTDQEIIDLTLAITTINTWNRINHAFANEPGTYRVGAFG